MAQKAFKKLSTAKRAANGGPIIKAGDFYIVGCEPLTEIAILNSRGNMNAFVNLNHFEKLGNANYATPDPEWAGKSSEFNYLKFYLGEK